MTEDDGVLSREVAIAAKLEENGIELRTKSRAIAALDRLVGSLFDMPAAFFEGISGKKRLKDTIYERLKNAQAQIAEQQITGTPALGAALIYDVLEDKARKQANLAGVAVQTINVIKTLPPPESESNAGTTNPPKDNIEDDWMNQFVRFAEDASSDQLQHIWGRVLAGEIRKPGSFSRHTLRFIAELDQETAQNCELIGRHVIENWIQKFNDWNQGDDLLVSIDMQRLGIIEGVGFSGPSQSFIIDANGTCGIAGNSWGLLLRGTPDTKVSFPVFMLTRMGQEVMSLLNVVDEVQSLRKIANQVEKSGLESIDLGMIVRLPGNQVNFPDVMERIWQVADQPPSA